jgi:3-hydroxyacyl-CoA dehydrogenase
MREVLGHAANLVLAALWRNAILLVNEGVAEIENAADLHISAK